LSHNINIHHSKISHEFNFLITTLNSLEQENIITKNIIEEVWSIFSKAHSFGIYLSILQQMRASECFPSIALRKQFGQVRNTE
jgi:hypothetical protein